MRNRPRDTRLIDALDGRAGVGVDEIVWRIAREGRDPTQCAATGGRWDDASFDVLYTSRTREGALAEMQFHLSRGQPVVPSRLRFTLHEIAVRLNNALDLSEPGNLGALGLDMAAYGQLSYVERATEYPRTQQIAEVAHFLGYDGLIVPSARAAVANVVVFCERVAEGQLRAVRDDGVVDWRKSTA